MRTIFGVLGLVAAVGMTACGDDKVTTGGDTAVTNPTSADTTAAETTVAETTAAETSVATETTETDTTVATETTETDTNVATETTATDTNVATETTETDTNVATETTATDTNVADTAAETETTGPTATEQIQAVLDALGTGATAAGPFTVAGAYVTYLKPAIGEGTDVKGFFIQGVQAGPALFVEWSGTPAVAAGDVVTVAFATVARNHTPPTALDVTAVTVSASGKLAEVKALAQDLTAVDFVTTLGQYENELIDIAGDVTSLRAPAGIGFESVKFDNDVLTASPNLELRYPAAIGPHMDLGPGCGFILLGVPVWRFDARAQVLFFDVLELEVTCDAPKVVGAKSLGPTSVAVMFDRAIDAASIDAVAAQFTFNGGLAASNAVVDGRTVIVTTGHQTGGQDYTVTVDDSVADVLGAGVDAAANTAIFKGFAPANHLLISEFDYDQEGTAADGMEFVEIFNPTDADVSLVGWKLVGMNGETGTSYKTIALDAAVAVPAHGYLVVGSKNLIERFTLAPDPKVVTLRFGTGATNETNQLQNGDPDALRLESAGGLVDAVSYEGSVTGSVEGTGLLRLVGQYDEGKFLINDFQRCPDAGDTDDNSKDFKLSFPPSPGVVNGCGAPQALR